MSNKQSHVVDWLRCHFIHFNSSTEMEIWLKYDDKSRTELSIEKERLSFSARQEHYSFIPHSFIRSSLPLLILIISLWIFFLQAISLFYWNSISFGLVSCSYFMSSALTSNDCRLSLCRRLFKVSARLLCGNWKYLLSNIAAKSPRVKFVGLYVMFLSCLVKKGSLAHFWLYETLVRWRQFNLLREDVSRFEFYLRT